ncbi:hypothetical protein ACOXXX_16085 [Thalassococcus sp. BH17M4-6]
MSRWIAPLVLALITGPAMAQNIVFELPRMDFPEPQPVVQTETVSTQGQ